MTNELRTRPAELLLVEDNPGDVRLTIEALKEGKLINNLTVVKDGEEAIAALRRQGKYADAPRPDLILLDLNLPRKGGLEVLTEIKQDPDLKQIPVVVLTTSRAEQDVLRTYEMHANCYIVKPVDPDALAQVRRLAGELAPLCVRGQRRRSGAAAINADEDVHRSRLHRVMAQDVGSSQLRTGAAVGNGMFGFASRSAAG